MHDVQQMDSADGVRRRRTPHQGLLTHFFHVELGSRTGSRQVLMVIYLACVSVLITVDLLCSTV